MLREGESVERLEGGLEIIQNERYYRFTSDSLLLSRFARGLMPQKPRLRRWTCR